MNSVFGLPTWCSSIPRDDDGANCQMFWKRNDITFGSPKIEMVFPTSWGCFLVTTLVDIAIQSSQRIWTMMCCWRWRTSLWLLEKLKNNGILLEWYGKYGKMIWLVSNMNGLFYNFSSMGCHPKPIDELTPSFFKMVKLHHHQPDMRRWRAEYHRWSRWHHSHNYPAW